MSDHRKVIKMAHRLVWSKLSNRLFTKKLWKLILPSAVACQFVAAWTGIPGYSLSIVLALLLVSSDLLQCISLLHASLLPSIKCELHTRLFWMASFWPLLASADWFPMHITLSFFLCRRILQKLFPFGLYKIFLCTSDDSWAGQQTIFLIYIVKPAVSSYFRITSHPSIFFVLINCLTPLCFQEDIPRLKRHMYQWFGMEILLMRILFLREPMSRFYF